MTGNLHEGHRKRVRKRYIESGLDSFEDHQVLELLLFYCVSRRDTNELAHKLINDFGSLANLFEADPLDIQSKSKVNEQTAVLISMIPSLARKYFNSRYGKKTVIDTSKKMGAFSVSLFAGKRNECFYCICLDNHRRLIASPLISEGTVNEAHIYPRQIAEAALKHKAVSIVLAHNHPTGDAEPSNSDISATKAIKAALEPLSIDVLDHIIVGGSKYYSFAEHHKGGL